MFNLPVFVGLDYHTKTIQVCVMDQKGKILANQSVANDLHAVFRVVAPYGNNVYAAIEASNNSSAGKTTTGGLIKAGDDLLRQVLVEAAHRLIRYNPEWKAMADRLRANGKKTCVIIAAVANRWIRKLFYQMRAPMPADGADVRFLRHLQESTPALETPSDTGRSVSHGTGRLST